MPPERKAKLSLFSSMGVDPERPVPTANSRVGATKPQTTVALIIDLCARLAGSPPMPGRAENVESLSYLLRLIASSPSSGSLRTVDTQATRPLTPKPEHSSTGLKATCLRFAVPGINSSATMI
ncbi:hypothetical protein HPB52_008346 [Rhipicephalus sanguineus]|uniref:Uncharacterized protein n=1 Tax=Rhipicephalus sanguineus TaxID=34632 RepID=A0A9D4PS73_RHISA|nr:hypothetical protein HPB52_008346 [Rhipicephalus sanguineus]